MVFFLALFSSTGFAAPIAAIDWSQPPVGCVEEIAPSLPDRPCLDLTSVINPELDWPNLDRSELEYWQAHEPATLYCRAAEIIRREKSKPGSFSATALEIAWMETVAVKHSDQKISAVYQASRLNHLPVQILTGAIAQESKFSELGISWDGGNYSCGIGQGNILEWCDWANTQSAATRAAIGWPSAGVSCNSLTPALLKPFYDIALTRLDGLPEYEMSAKQFQNIDIQDVDLNPVRYQLVLSFINHCSDPVYGILAKAHELAELYRDFVPRGLKAHGLYAEGESFHRQCREQGYMGAYPLNLGWLLAVGIYNSGPRAVDALAYYYDWNETQLRDPATWDGFQPSDMVEAFYGAGQYNSKTDLIDFTNLYGAPEGWPWFKSCVLQRHIARVIQNVTLHDQPALVESLEGSLGCGTLLQSAVPVERQNSSGRWEAKELTISANTR